MPKIKTIKRLSGAGTEIQLILVQSSYGARFMCLQPFGKRIFKFR